MKKAARERLFQESALRGNDVHNLLLDDTAVKVGLAAAPEGDLADNHGVEGVVMANLNVLARLDLSTALTDDNHAWASCLAIRKLNAEKLRV